MERRGSGGPGPDVSLTRVHDDDAVVIAHAGPLLVAVFVGVARVAHLDRLKALADALIAEHGKLGLLLVALETRGGLRITTDVRQRAVEITRELDRSMVGSAFVLRFGGLSGVIARTFLSWLNRLAGNRAPQRTCASVSEGLAWLQALPGHPVVVGETGLCAEIEAILTGRSGR